MGQDPSILDFSAPEQPAAYIAKLAMNRFQVSLGNLIADYLVGFSAIWQPASGAGYTTEEVLAALGVYAADYVSRMSALKDFLLAQQPGCIPDDKLEAPVDIVKAEDGSIAVSAAAVAEAEIKA